MSVDQETPEHAPQSADSRSRYTPEFRQKAVQLLAARTGAAVREVVFEHVEAYYNRQHLHSALGQPGAVRSHESSVVPVPVIRQDDTFAFIIHTPPTASIPSG